MKKALFVFMIFTVLALVFAFFLPRPALVPTQSFEGTRIPLTPKLGVTPTINVYQVSGVVPTWPGAWDFVAPYKLADKCPSCPKLIVLMASLMTEPALKCPSEFMVKFEPEAVRYQLWSAEGCIASNQTGEYGGKLEYVWWTIPDDWADWLYEGVTLWGQVGVVHPDQSGIWRRDNKVHVYWNATRVFAWAKVKDLAPFDPCPYYKPTEHLDLAYWAKNFSTKVEILRKDNNLPEEVTRVAPGTRLRVCIGKGLNRYPRPSVPDGVPVPTPSKSK